MSQSVVAALALVGCVVVGTVVHELAHVTVLSLLGVPYDVRVFRRDDAGSGRLSGALVSVVPDHTTDRTAGLRVAALMPLALAVPLLLVPLGVVPDPFVTGDLPAQLALVGWLACAIPSPQDFSVVWYAGQGSADCT